MEPIDFFDPNTWNFDYEYRIYADNYENVYAIVDQIDYQYLIQWRWKISKSRSWAGTKKPKIYLARSGHEKIGEDYFDDCGKRVQQRRVSTIYLHDVIMKRTGIELPKTNKKIIIDHANGNGLDCRRLNLRYATISFNNKNLFGSLEKSMI